MSRTMTPVTGTSSSGIVARPAGEAAARDNASAYATGRPLPNLARSESRGPQSDFFEEAGRDLNKSERNEMEPRFGRDFSNVRVHTNSPEADAMGARAFAVGNDIGFAPGESPDQNPSLLAHELTHVAQQADGGKPEVQKEPKDGAKGIGAAPPSEPFDRADKPGDETEAVLFEFNDASLTTAALAALKKIADAQSGPVQLEIHGYASMEGEPEYNINLSAHRAAAVKTELLRLLPKDSTVHLVAHGETDHFGPSEKNRRAGFTVAPLPTPSSQKKQDDWSLDPSGQQETRPPLVLFPPRISLPDQPNFTAPYAVVPPLDPAFTIDWLSVQNKFASYGVPLDPKMADSIESFADRYVSIYGPTLLPIAIGVATSGYLQYNNPTWWDVTDREIKAAYPDSKSTPQVPINSVIDFIYQKKTGQDKASLFDF